MDIILFRFAMESSLFSKDYYKSGSKLLNDSITRVSKNIMRRLQTGEKIGDYVIRGFLGAGGMGEVYQGEHTRINRLAAIKVLSRYGNNPTFISRFLNEARVQSSLHHPNIVTLYDFKEINGQLFIFMEFADGDTLEDLIKRKFFAVEEALRSFEAMCEAVAFIHQNGIVHRDIKAQNVKLTSNGVIKLLDFGIAKDAASQRLTKVGGMIGTPHYLAPEQLAGQEATSQTDIWALGVLFYGMLTGVEPFTGETFGELHSKISAASFELPERINPAIKPEVSQIIAKSLEKQPEHRYRMVEEILEDVRKILSGEKQRQAFFGSPKKSKKNAPRNIPGSELPQKSDAPKSRSMVFVAAVSAFAVMLVFGIVGIGIWAMSDGGGSNQGNSNIIIVNPVNKTTPNSSISKNTGQLSPQSGSKSNSVRVLVDANEGAAEVYRDGQLIGKTPLEVEGGEGENVSLMLKRDGFQDQQVKLEISARRKVYTFALQRK